MRVAVLSDIHANLEALEAVRGRIHSAGADEVWILGDLVGYGADPVPVVETARRIGVRTICGNHDLATLGRFDVSWFNSAAAAAVRWTQQELSDEARAYLEQLAPRDDGEVLLVHASVRDPVAEYVVDIIRAAVSFEGAEFTRCFYGHTHLPAMFSLDERGRVGAAVPEDGDPVRLASGRRYLLNPGSVGQPRDGDARASFMIYDSDADTVVLHRVPYDIERAQQKIRSAGLPARLADRLAVGE